MAKGDRSRRSGWGGSGVTGSRTGPFGMLDFPEIPASNRVRDQAKPRVPAVVVHEVAAGVLAGEQPLGSSEPLVLCAGAGHLADDLDRAVQFGTAQLAVVLLGVDQHGHPRVALEVGPSLAGHHGGQPQCRSVPDVPHRGQVRTARPHGRDPARALAGQEVVEFRGGHGDLPAAPLLADRGRHTSPRSCRPALFSFTRATLPRMVPDMATGLAQLAGQLEVDLLSDGRPANPMVVLPLDRWRDASTGVIDRAAGLVAGALPVTVGVLHGPPSPGLQALIAAATLTLGETASGDATPALVPVGDIPGAADLPEALGRLRAAIARSPRAAIACGQLLRQTAMLDVTGGLGAEAAAYSLLLGG